jgi:signal transduction histidine kinase/CheY-like chemotaxis protein
VVHPQTLLSRGEHLKLSVFILGNIELILQDWEGFARTMSPAASPMSSKELRNHASVMLESIAKDLCTSQSKKEELVKSLGNEPRTSQTAAGEEHGQSRMLADFTIEQLVSEYRALRSSVLRLWNEANGEPKASDIDDIIRFNEAIDQLLASSVMMFAKATREAVEAEKKRKDNFLAMLAHELRNPLSPISAAATLLKMSNSNEKIINNASNIIARQVSHMATLIDDLLDVSRVTRGSIELKSEMIDLRHVIDDAVEQVLPQVHAHGHVLTVSDMSRPVIIEGDKKRLVQVFANILTNAAKYTPENGNIALRLDITGENVEVTIEDNGIGMAPDFMPHVFDLFAQAERSSDRSAGGLGLGLALAKSLIELHSGKLTCFSDGVSKGSQFTVQLPKRISHDVFNERRRSPRMNLMTAEMLKIMVVDDNIDAAAMLAMLLEAAGHRVVVAHRADQALDQSKDENPNVYVLDIGLPDVDGNELARHIRARPETVNAVLIALTGYGLPEDHEKTTAAGFNYHLVKPVDTEKLYKILANVHPSEFKK